MPVEFLSDEQAAACGRLPELVSRAELQRFFFLDDVDRGLVEAKRREHNKLGFALPLVTVRNVGAFLDDPLDVPAEVVDYLAEQLGITDSSCVKSYGEREKTRFRARLGAAPGASSRRWRPSWASGSRPAPGPPGTGRRRCSTPRWRGCGSAVCCCRA
ncbi:DUF4158 domain-containing protein [Saccharopolyspora karakumensis]|uniref:DUF4158 domain-containing protein n=1 Tax=Saccharopolyspora karakumensis TaxID=2530386 RepID=UPI0038B6A527